MDNAKTLKIAALEMIIEDLFLKRVELEIGIRIAESEYTKARNRSRGNTIRILEGYQNNQPVFRTIPFAPIARNFEDAIALFGKNLQIIDNNLEFYRNRLNNV